MSAFRLFVILWFGEVQFKSAAGLWVIATIPASDNRITGEIMAEESIISLFEIPISLNQLDVSKLNPISVGEFFILNDELPSALLHEIAK